MSSDEIYLSRAEVALTDQEWSLKQALVVRDMARLATVLALEQNEARSVVDAMRVEVREHTISQLDQLHMHLMGALAIFATETMTEPVGDVADSDEREPLYVESTLEGTLLQKVVDKTTHDTPLTQGEAVARPSINLEQETEGIVLNARAARFMNDIFGDYTELNLQEADKPCIVTALMTLRGEVRRTPKAVSAAASLRMRLGLLLAGATNSTIAMAEGHKDERVLANAFTRFKMAIRDNAITADEARAVLAETVGQIGEIAPVDEVDSPPSIAHENQVPISTISYTSTVSDKPRARDVPPHREVPLSISQPDFDRLKAAVKEALGDNASLLVDDATIDDLTPVIQAAYEQEFGLGDSKQFLQYYLATLKAEARPRDLFKKCAMEPAKISRAARVMPALIAATLRGDAHAPASAIVATPPTVVTPRLMPARQQ